MSSNPPSEIQCIREEYDAKLRSNAAEIAELKTMLHQVLQTLQHIGVQQNSSNASRADQTEPMVIDNTQDKENETPKRSGTDSPTYEEPSRSKRPDHKPSPAKKLDFRKDE
jgi:hypothetical protein